MTPHTKHYKDWFLQFQWQLHTKLAMTRSMRLTVIYDCSPSGFMTCSMDANTRDCPLANTLSTAFVILLKIYATGAQHPIFGNSLRYTPSSYLSDWHRNGYVESLSSISKVMFMVPPIFRLSYINIHSGVTGRCIG